MEKQWTLIAKAIEKYVEGGSDSIIGQIHKSSGSSEGIKKILVGHSFKDGATEDQVVGLLLRIKNNEITELKDVTVNSNSSNITASGVQSTVPNNEGGLNSTVSRIPITDPKEALEFAKTEWNKIRRTSGHELECQVFGSHHWQVGEWCKVYLPTLNEYTDMYITKVDNSNDSGSEWLTSITLRDYAPSLSTVDESKVKEVESNSNDSTTGTSDGSQEGTETNKWSEIANILQKYFEKPSDGWDNKIQAIRGAKVYDPDIKNVIMKLTKKGEFNRKTHVDIGHELCKVMDITY